MKEDLELIEAVRKHPELYDKFNSNYMNIEKKDKIWKDISSKLKMEAKKRWTMLRDRYVREIKKNRNTWNKNRNAWMHFDQMTFLDDHLQPKKPKFRFTKEEEPSDDEINEDSRSEVFNDSAFKVSSLTPKEGPPLPLLLPLPSTARKRKKLAEDNDIQTFFLENLQLLKTKLAQDTEDDEDDLFLKCVRKKMERMNVEEKSQFRMQLLYLAEEAVRKSET